jgi:hypothetical protein
VVFATAPPLLVVLIWIVAPWTVELSGIWIVNAPVESVVADVVGPLDPPFIVSTVVTWTFFEKPWPLTVIVSLEDPAVTVIVPDEEFELLVLFTDEELVVFVAAVVLEDVTEEVVVEEVAVGDKLFTIVAVSIAAFSVYVATKDPPPVECNIKPLPLNTVEPESPADDPALVITETA